MAKVLTLAELTSKQNALAHVHIPVMIATLQQVADVITAGGALTEDTFDILYRAWSPVNIVISQGRATDRAARGV